MEQGGDPFDKLPDEVFQLIFQAVADCKSLVRCMAVSKAFREQSERVSALSITCPGQFTSYVDKLQRIFAMVRSFHCLEKLVVRVGQPKDEPPSWARCMRYAEIGSAVEKFIFMAAKSGEFSDFDLASRDLPVTRKERKESSSEGEADAGRQPFVSEIPVAVESSEVNVDGASSSRALEESDSQRVFPDFSLRQVVAPSNDVLKRMVPVIVFAIVQGLDEFRDSVPDFICKFHRLRSFLLVDMLESVTVLMREHQIEQIRTQARNKPKQDESEQAGEQVGEEQVDGTVDNKQVGISGVLEAEEEASEMSRHDGLERRRAGEQQEDEPTSSSPDRKGKGLDSGEEPTDRKHKGKEIDVTSEGGESSTSGVSSLKNENYEEGDEEVNSPVRSTDLEASNSAQKDSSAEPDQPENFPRDGNRLFSDEGAQTWRSCSGISIHVPEEGREESVFSQSYRRALRNRENSRLRTGVRRRDRSVDWLDDSVRRRHENRLYKGLAFRRREESRALRTWRLGKRARGEGDEAQSVMESSLTSPPSTSGCNELTGEGSSGGGGEVPEGVTLDPLGESAVSSRSLEEGQFVFSQQTGEAETQGHTEVRTRGRTREVWREAWRETWSERLGRRARELRREMQSQEMEREGARRERLRENVRKRQMEIEREALRFDITFWRAEEVRTRNGYRLCDVSMCIATHSSKPLSVFEVESLASSALAGPLLAATIALVNEQASFHNL